MAVSTTSPHSGVQCYQATFTGASPSLTFGSPYSSSTLYGFPGAPVVVGSLYEASAWVRNGTGDTVLSARVTINWYTSAGALISTTAGTQTAETNNVWTRVAVTGTAPATAVRAGVTVSWSGGASTDIHFVDDLYFRLYDAAFGAPVLKNDAARGGAQRHTEPPAQRCAHRPEPR